MIISAFFFFQAEDGIRDRDVTGVQTCALPIFAISALDDQGLVPVIEEATKAGIKVITFDAPAPSSKALTYIGTMNEAAGRSEERRVGKECRSGWVTCE